MIDTSAEAFLANDLSFWKARASALMAKRDAAQAEAARLREAISWALGEGNSDFADHMPGNGPRFWWRAELKRRAALAQETRDD